MYPFLKTEIYLAVCVAWILGPRPKFLSLWLFVPGESNVLWAKNKIIESHSSYEWLLLNLCGEVVAVFNLADLATLYHSGNKEMQKNTLTTSEADHLST